MLASGYLDRVEQWDELAVLLRDAGVMGLDTEYFGVDDKKSPVGRSVIHVWSVAIRSERLGALGFHPATGWMLPAAALLHPGLVAVLEDADITKAVHNQSVDHHALRNHGITLRGSINTLGYIRWQRPDLINLPGRFKLKALMNTLLHREPICTFKELISWERTDRISTWKTVVTTVCSCGVAGCKKRVGHEKTYDFDELETVKEKKLKGVWHLSEIVPGHERWDLMIRYSIEDSVAALEVLELGGLTPDPAPFPYSDDEERPGFSQPAEEAIIAMEAVGFPVDSEWCGATVSVAEADEEDELAWLHGWFVANAPTEGPHRRADVDPIWSSPTQKVVLFDALGFPRSPIWSKGRVKRGDVKMDGAAMAWIAAAEPGATQLIAHMLHLQRIRSGKKYLVKLRDSGGWVHPICGPAGDEDDRAGAVTGRLGIKGELEAQQLPKAGDKDLYGIRKAIVAEDNRVQLVREAGPA